MASYLDLLPPELLDRVLTSVGSLDLYFLSLTSKEWNQQAWNFLRYLDFRSFYAASVPHGKSGTHKHRKWCKHNCSLLMLPSYPDIDVAKLPSAKSFLPIYEPQLLRTSASVHGLKSSTQVLDAEYELSETSRSEERASKRQQARKTKKTSLCRRVMPPQPRPFSYHASNKTSLYGISSAPTPHSDPVGALIYTHKWKPHRSLDALISATPKHCIGEISLTGCYVYPKLFKTLAYSSARGLLRSLNLSCVYGFSASSMAHVASLDELQCLSLRGCEGVGDATLQHLRKMTSLTFLDIRDSLCVSLSSKDMNWRHLSTSSAVPPPSLSKGYDAEEKRRMSDFSIFRELPDFDEPVDPTEERFEVCDIRTSGTSVSSGWYTPAHDIFASVSELKNLVTLLVTEWNRSADFPEYGRYMNNNASLRSLALQYADPLSGWKKLHRHLESLSFASGRYANYFVAAKHFENLQLPNLSFLDLTRCYRVNDAAIAVIVVAAPQLKELKLGFCDAVSNRALSDSIVPHLNKTLTSLDLRHIDSIGGSGIRTLAQLSKLNKLTLAGIPHLRCLSFLVELPELAFLDLSRCPHLYLDTIAELVNAKALKKLSLRACPRITYESIRPLLEKSASLSSIDMRECPLISRALKGAISISKSLRCCLVTPIEGSI